MTAELELEVGSVAAGGACVARAPDGRVVFVRHAIPGERVRAVVTATTKTYLRADAVAVLDASPDRVAPPCRYARPGRCGGCDWQHIALPRQRLLKGELVAEQLQRLSGVTRDVVVEAVPGDVDGLRWRTRVQFAVDREGRPGLHKHRSHQLEHIDACLIATEAVEAVGAERLSWPGAQAVEVTAAGAQRVAHVVGRRVVDLPDVDAGLVVNDKPRRVPHGVRHDVLGRRFEVSAGGFWQVHPGAAAVLAQAVLDGLDPRPGNSVVDLYAGVGLFAALLADRVGPEGSVLAIEGDRRACADAARNTADQAHAKVRTAAIDAATVRRLARPDLVVLDPPRAGAGTEVAQAIVGLVPRRVAYVACDPATFARDLRVFVDAGWAMSSLRAFDVFPMTEHVEVVAILQPAA